jgi:hypothetical protein
MSWRQQAARRRDALGGWRFYNFKLKGRTKNHELCPKVNIEDGIREPIG